MAEQKKASKSAEDTQKEALAVYSDIKTSNPRVATLIPKELEEIKGAALKLVKGGKTDETQIEKIHDATDGAIERLQKELGNPDANARWKSIVNSVIKKLEPLQDGDESVPKASKNHEHKILLGREINKINQSSRSVPALQDIIREGEADLRDAYSALLKADGTPDTEQTKKVHDTVKDMKTAVQVFKDTATAPAHKTAADSVTRSLDAIDKHATEIEKTVKEPKKGAALDGIDLPEGLPKFAVASVEQQGAPASTPLGKSGNKEIG